MWLVDTDTIKMKWVLDERQEKYAILSHRWLPDGEVAFQDMSKPKSTRPKAGHRKVVKTCQIAAELGYHYVWIDTCCINKDSSAELQEAINSMFRWYQCAEVCLVHLADVAYRRRHKQVMINEMSASEWFTRGWTLQELLAPKRHIFFDKTWTRLGDKAALASTLAEITGIDPWVLDSPDKIHRCSIAKRMSWSARRATTRPEDRAYCLLGLFDVNMPLLYGEGDRAFMRLQEEIIKRSDDQSIFAWPLQNDRSGSLIAPRPEAFYQCGDINPFSWRHDTAPSYTTTNRGLLISNVSVKVFALDMYLIQLDCHKQKGSSLIGILLRRDEGNSYVRISSEGVSLFDFPLQPSARGNVEEKSLIVRQPTSGFIRASKVINGYRLEFHGRNPNVRSLWKGYPRTRLVSSDDNIKWDPVKGLLTSKPLNEGQFGLLVFDQTDHGIKALKLGFDFDFNPICFIALKDPPSCHDGHICDMFRAERCALVNPKKDQAGCAAQTAIEVYFPGIPEEALDPLRCGDFEVGSQSELRPNSGLWCLKGYHENDESPTFKPTHNLRLCFLRDYQNGGSIWQLSIHMVQRLALC